MQLGMLEVDVHTAKMWLDKKEAVLIDVREPSEFESVSIASAVLIPLASITADKLPILESGQKLIIQCARGFRSATAIERLSAIDPELPLYNLKGGILEWIQLGLPVISAE